MDIEKRLQAVRAILVIGAGRALSERTSKGGQSDVPDGTPNPQSPASLSKTEREVKAK